VADQVQRWRIGDLAVKTGITVRALHHYDRLGLVSPSWRTAGGHRWYTGDDVRRLHRVIALRSFGLSLEEIRSALDADAGYDPAGLLRRQLDQVDARIRQAIDLRTRLLGVLGALGRLAEPSPAQFLRLIEETITMTQPLTPEQLTRLNEERARHLASLTPEELDTLNRHRAEALAALSEQDLARLQAQRQQALPRP
jgi:DNA-binding transcriptional MerR regulator